MEIIDDADGTQHHPKYASETDVLTNMPTGTILSVHQEENIMRVLLAFNDLMPIWRSEHRQAFSPQFSRGETSLG